MAVNSALSRSFENLRALGQDIMNIKNARGDPNELADKRKQALLLFVLIKKLNRVDKYGLRSGREELQGKKLECNRLQQNLQNLLYEVGYLRREIRRCHQFKSQDEDIDLLPESHYLAVVKQDPIPVTTKHEKRLLRLQSELNLRKQLSVEYKDLANSKKQVVQDIVMKIERLNSFAPSLNTLVKATKPLQEALQAPLDREWRISRLVQQLPQPLYLAYMNIHALEIVFEADVTVEIVHQPGMQHLRSFDSAENLQTAMLQFELENDMSGTQSLEHLLMPHPLVVQFTIGGKANERECIVINMRYIPRLSFVTAASTMNLEDMEGEVAATQDVLRTLYDNDIGDSIPVSKAEYVLKKSDFTAEQCLQYLGDQNLGKPYRWTQHICCIETFSNTAEGNVIEAKLQEEIAVIIQRVQEVWNSRLNLIKQIKALVNKNIIMYLKDEKLPSSQPSCSLVQWTSLTWDEYMTNNVTAVYIASNLTNASQLFYRAIVVRGSAKMECVISVSSKFPNESPFWIITIHWNGEHNAANSAAVKQLEFTTNTLSQEELQNPHALLSYQLFHTMYSFDVFLETEGPDEFSKEKHYIKAFTKRSRSRPFSPHLLYLLN